VTAPPGTNCMRRYEGFIVDAVRPDIMIHDHRS
jgi:hypothetical protein